MKGDQGPVVALVITGALVLAWLLWRQKAPGAKEQSFADWLFGGERGTGNIINFGVAQEIPDYVAVGDIKVRGVY